MKVDRKRYSTFICYGWITSLVTPKSQYVINVIILNTKKIVYLNARTGGEMQVEMVKY